ncbi:phospholipase A [Desulfobacterium sp. N47]|uniref:phospholipase A n=1 Tax=Desulfobacterium sp. N47 TaxID=3115210 RepID=UPI003F4A71A4
MFKILVAAFFVFLNSAAFAAEFETIIVPPSDPVIAGDTITVEVYFMNLSNHGITLQTSELIESRLIKENTISELQLTPKPFDSLHEIVIPANGFLKKAYTCDVPESLEGSVGIELVKFASKRALFNILKKGDNNTTQCVIEKVKGNDAAEEIQTLFQSEFPYFPTHEPTYFGVGTDPEKSKFQLSFKYNLVNLTRNNSLLNGFHFGYTQTSLWDLKSDSKPFEDTSYKPEIFYLTKNLNPGIPLMSHLCFMGGFQHESNGKGGTDSRSTNFLYIKPILAFKLGNDYHLKVGPKAWIYTGNDDQTNPYIENYRGYFDLELKLGKRDGLVLGSNLRYGNKGGSIQVDATYPMYKCLFLDVKKTWLNPNLYFLVQYYDGYAESLIRYNEKSHALRLGISIVR